MHGTQSVVNVETAQWKTEIFEALLVLTRKGSTYNEATDRCVASSTLLRNSGVHSLCEIRKLQLYVNRPLFLYNAASALELLKNYLHMSGPCLDQVWVVKKSNFITYS